MVRAAFAALAAVIFSPAAGNILRPLNFENISNESNDSGNHIGRWAANGQDNNRANVFVDPFVNDLESHVPLLRVDNQQTEEIGDLIAPVRREAPVESRNHTLWNMLGINRAVAVFDRVAVMMNAWPVPRAIVSILSAFAYVGLMMKLQAARTRGIDISSMHWYSSTMLGIYMCADMMLMMRLHFIDQEARLLSPRIARSLRATLARAAAIFRQPTAVRVIDEQNCAICKNDITDTPSVLTCGHSFHRKCVLRWAEMPEGGTCPICRIKYSA